MTTNMSIKEGFNVDDAPGKHTSSVRGHVIFTNGETDEVLFEKDNLILMRTRVWLFEQLFKVSPPTTYAPPAVIDNTRSVVLFSIGSGGADVNANAFTPYVPKFSDTQLGQAIPFIIVDPDKNNDIASQSNPSIVESLTPEQERTYYMSENMADGTTAYYAKRFSGASDSDATGSSSGWNIDSNTGEVSFTLNMSIDDIDARGLMLNEIGLWLGTYDDASNSYKNTELLSRLTFNTESLQNVTKTINIKYVLYI